MSNETKEKLNKYLLPAYRSISVTLLSVLTIFLIKTYNMIYDDHDKRILMEEQVRDVRQRVTALEILPPKVQQLEHDVKFIQDLDDEKRKAEVEHYLKSKP